MIDHAALLADLKKQVTALERHLAERADSDEAIRARLRGEWQAAREANRTAATYESWLRGPVTQAAVAWVLGTVFLRFCEDNQLIELPYLAGPDDRLDLAQERQSEFIHEHPMSTDRDWILAGFDAMSRSKVVAGLFDRAHNPMWQIEIPHHAAKDLLAFWRRRGDDGQIVHDLTDSEWGTRFLGDLYQDLSEDAKKTYALLQTPEFVEEFILNYTLEPAIDEFGLAGLRTIDPTCGSGHFLLGIFHRLLSKWRDAEPDTDTWTLIRRSLESVHGVDKNPFAAAIARFRLLVAAMKQGGERSLAKAPEFPILVGIGDSLLHGRGGPQIQDDLFGESVHTYATEDINDYVSDVDILGNGTYHVVVGNPPYITVKDKQENQNYRNAYETCTGKYALSVPFTERFFRLGRRGGSQRQGAGYIGEIVSNSFMKREFGRKLIEEFLVQEVELSYVVDTSGCNFRGFGVPTVILVGRPQVPSPMGAVRAVMGLRGGGAADVENGSSPIWRAVVAQADQPNSESEWVSVIDVSRTSLASHPWSLNGGGATDLRVRLESKGITLKDRGVDIGMTVLTLEDEAFLVSRARAGRMGIIDQCAQIVIGDDIHDYVIESRRLVIMSCSWQGEPVEVSPNVLKYFWNWRTNLRSRLYFGKRPEERGLRWFDLGMYFPSRHVEPLSIALAQMGMRNNLSLSMGGSLFKQSAPVIKLPTGAREAEYFELLEILGSSIACFWLKLVSHNYGDKVDSHGSRLTGDPSFDTYDFTATTLLDFPLPQWSPKHFSGELGRLAQSLVKCEPATAFSLEVPDAMRLESIRREQSHIRGRMVAVQEELDWECYRLYGLLTDDEAAGLQADPETLPELRLGERAFEIVLARKMARGQIETQWFARHESTPVTEIPTHWSETYRKVVEARIENIERRRDIALIERPECKRRWSTEPWEKKEKAALRTWLLDKCEDKTLWYVPDEYGTDQPKPLTVNQLADRLRQDPDVVSVARLYAGRDAELATVIAEIVADEHVPYLAQLRYKDTGLSNRAQWEQVWDLQREEDQLTAEQGKDVRLDIPVPPKYKQADFLKPSYWKNRGKLDVPKERFISYPHASPDADESLLLGWAGWDHREQALALTTLIEDRTARDGWSVERVTPLIAGLAELMPWVRQWHAEIDPDYGRSPAEAFSTYLESKQLEYGLSTEALRSWRPAQAARGRRSTKAK